VISKTHAQFGTPGTRSLDMRERLRDITERKRAEQAVSPRGARSSDAAAIGDAVISTDADGRIEYINPVPRPSLPEPG